MMERVTATDAAYIKLGRSGQWERLCREDGTARLGYNDVDHDLALSGDRGGLRQHFIDQGLSQGAASSHASQVLRFYDDSPDTIWVTFSGGRLWWAFLEGPVEYLGGSPEEMETRGSRLRRTRDGWHSTSAAGKPLLIPELNGALTRTAAYRGTICSVDRFDYLMRKVNDESLPEIDTARQARHEMLTSIRELTAMLTWQDFELLVELVFAGSGWRRVSATGGTQKTIDLELVMPLTDETAFVQVKSRTDQAQFDDYLDRFAARSDDRMFYVYHTAAKELRNPDSAVTMIGPDRLASLVLEAGLFDWLLEKAD